MISRSKHFKDSRFPSFGSSHRSCSGVSYLALSHIKIDRQVKTVFLTHRGGFVYRHRVQGSRLILTVLAGSKRYVEAIEASALVSFADSRDLSNALVREVGHFVLPGTPLAL